MPKIIQLDRHVADLIAAGEVVERPASAVKELVENSIDAGAKNITIELQNGGMTFLRITDDGCGMDPVDARTAFLRHATSKIRRQEDLACIGTLGFRGEALAAISSVSKIDLLTRAQGAENGVRLHLEAGKVLSEEPVGCPCGTTILVRELFYNTPARMKFMKSDAAESSAVFSVVQQQALAHPEISFRFLKDGQEQLHTDGQGDRMAAIYAIYGRELANNMLPVDGSWEKLRVRGFVTKPTATRGNRAWQSFFVNNRYIKSRLLSAAVEACTVVDECVGRMVAAVEARKGRMLLIADHGNCEVMKDGEGKPQTAHTTNPVPCILLDASGKEWRLHDGKLADVAPTLLRMWGIAQPEAMTGTPLVEEAHVR